MGGGYYDREVEVVADQNASFSVVSNTVLNEQKSLHPELNIFQKTIQCYNNNPIVICADVTGSMGKWPKVIWDKMPMFFGQLKKYISDPAFSFCAIGDAYGDVSPLQVSPFAIGNSIDDYLSKLHLEGGGSGKLSNHETYELAAYYYARHVYFHDQGKKPFLFFIGDEAFYDEINGDHLKNLIIGEAPNTIYTFEIMKELVQRYHVYLIHKTLDYGGPDDYEVVEKWTKVLGVACVLKLDNPKACVDVMIGVLAIKSIDLSLENYVLDLRERGQSEARIKEVIASLQPLFYV